MASIHFQSMTGIGSQAEPNTCKQHISQHRLDITEQKLYALNVVVDNLWILRTPDALRCLHDIGISIPGHVGRYARNLMVPYTKTYDDLAKTLKDTAKHVISSKKHPSFMQAMWRRMHSDDPRVQRIHRELEWGGQDLQYAIQNLAFDSPHDSYELIKHLRNFFN